LKILSSSVSAGNAPVGQVVERSGGVAIGTGAGLFIPTSVQLAGKKATAIRDFLRGYPRFIGAQLN